jgi:putative endopeptidase
MRARDKRIPALALAGALAGCGGAQKPAEPAPPAPASQAVAPQPEQTTLKAVGLDPDAIDKTADPCVDFYQYACGNWIAHTEIPADKPIAMRSFVQIEDENLEKLRGILEAAQKAESPDPIQKKIGTFYGACMDEPSIEKAGLGPLQPLLATAKRVKDQKSLAQAITELHRHKIWVFWDLGPQQDFADATQMIAGMDQDGLGLPDRDFYLSADQKDVLEAYKAHVAKVFELSGDKPDAAKKAAANVLDVEVQIAKLSQTRAERSEYTKLYHRVERVGLAKLMPAFPWDDYFKGLSHEGIQAISVASPDYFTGTGKLLASLKPEVARDYLRFHVVHSQTSRLSKAFVDEGFKLRSAITGQPEIEARWKRCVGATDDALGEALGQRFVDQYFPPASKADSTNIVESIAKAMGEDLGTLTWMDAATREKAAAKLKAMVYHIGYPDKWKTYDFDVKPEAYAANAIAADVFDFQRDLDKIGKPVDKSEWGMTPPTVNAYYDPSLNEMVFPAGILQPPFYAAKNASPVNLGAIGFVMGHELTHGFDNSGAKFDGDGNLKDWWAPDVEKQFEGKGKCIADQYSKYEPLPGKKLNGEQVEGENIADNGGLKLAYRAFKTMSAGKPPVLADGYTPDQQFFLAAAQAWCAKPRDAYMNLVITVDVHSPAKFRVIGPMSNMPEFAEAFQCKAGTPMHPANACTVW